MVGGKELLVAQCNKNFSATAKHSFSKNGINLSWTGPYTVMYNNKTLQ
jgi:hypothetical protein